MAKIDLQLDLLVVCDQAFVSKENKLSLIGIFDQIFTDKLPFNYLKLAIVAVIRGEPNGNYSVRLEIKDPSGKTTPSPEFKFTLGSNGKTNLISEFGNLPLPLDGIYKVSLFVGKKAIGQTGFTVARTSAPSSVPGSNIVN